MIRTALLDDHAAVRAGLEAIVAPEPDLDLVGAAASEAELWPLLRRTRPDVVVLDLHHPGRDGLRLCLAIKLQPHPPAVVIYSASHGADLVVAAALAGAGAVVSKSSPSASLLTVIRALARSPRTLPPISLRTRREVAARLDVADHAILAMRLAGDPPADIGDTLGASPADITNRLAAIIGRLERNGNGG